MDDHSPGLPAWRRVMADAVTRPAELLQMLELDPALPALGFDQLRDFTLRVPRGFVQRMRKGDARDPLFLQVWPQPQEGLSRADEVFDAVGDLAKLKSGGVIHKYHGRALLVATGACAVHCRYCFRRHFPYNDAVASRDGWRDALNIIASDPSIEDKLAGLAQGLDAIPHVRRLRIHTRLPVVVPERVDGALLKWLCATRLSKVVVLHANHANEINASVAHAAQALRGIGALVLNQAVLLKGVNDSPDSLVRLSEALFAGGILPYYLHVLDRVQGVGHFEMDVSVAIALMQEVAARLPGYLVPRLAREDAGASAKTLLLA
jgi:EF-P beta-lysylation protein EpmB